MRKRKRKYEVSVWVENIIALCEGTSSLIRFEFFCINTLDQLKSNLLDVGSVLLNQYFFQAATTDSSWTTLKY